MWRRGVDLGIIDCCKLSIELENFTFPLVEDTEGRGTLRGLDEEGKSSEKKITSVQAPMGGPGMRLQPVLRMSPPHPLGCVTLPAVWMRP